jgi:hypothetical protein
VTPAEYGRALAQDAPPLTDEQVTQAARLYALGDDASTTAA